MTTRQTKYSKAVTDFLEKHDHATNSQILEYLHEIYPELSATTVHRVTARLCEQNRLAIAPPSSDGSMRYDYKTKPHDHFICNSCGGIRDIDVAESLIPLVNKALGGCKISGNLLIHGSCETCILNSNK